MLLHHTLGNGDFNVFANMNAEISCDVAKLNNPSEIANQIDNALRQCFIKSRPVYIMLPTDRVESKIEGKRLQQEIDLAEPENNPEKEDYVVDVIMRSLRSAKNPLLLIDACAIRHRVLDEVHELIEKTKLPVFVTPMGKGAVNEHHATYGGVYAGAGSHPEEVKDMVEASDLILTIGAIKVRAPPLRYGNHANSLCRAISTRLASPTVPLSSTPLTSTAITASCVTPHTQMSE